MVSEAGKFEQIDVHMLLARHQHSLDSSAGSCSLALTFGRLAVCHARATPAVSSVAGVRRGGAVLIACCACVRCSKPHLNIGTIGHVDHGKTTLTAAITRVSAGTCTIVARFACFYCLML